MKTKPNRLLAKFLAIMLVIAMLPLAAVPAVAAEDYGTQRDYVVSLIKSAGMSENMLGTNNDRDALAKSLGFLDNWDYSPDETVTAEVKTKMDIAMDAAFKGLSAAYNKKPMEPYFVHGMAQPIFNYGNSIYYDTSGEGVVRFIVYVETDLDTDGDGKLDLVKTLVQLPKAALEGAKLSTIYEARPYIEGTGSQSVPTAAQNAGNTYLTANPDFSHGDLYKTALPRVPAGVTSSAIMAANADYTDWYYRYSYSSSGNGSATRLPGNGANETEYEDLNWYDYYLVRGFAVVESAGIGSAGSEGYSSCGADIEINAFKAVIEWLTGDRKAFSDKTNNIEVKADWSNGKVGMTGRSYSGTTQFGLATSGVKGLKTIVPVAGIASWYEYTNSQGAFNSSAYTTGLAWYVNSRLAAPDWTSVFSRYAGFSQLMRREEVALNGDYGDHWARRDYTQENWYKDWGPSKIQTPMLIVHGANDDNVRPKQSVLMYQAAKKAGVDVKWIWHQGHHMTPTFPKATPNATDADRPYEMYCGDYTYDEWLNMWFSHHLYDVDNGIMELLPNVLAQDNDSAEWVAYDSWESPSRIILDNKNRVVSTPAPALRSRVMYEAPVDYSEEYPIPAGSDNGSGNSNAGKSDTEVITPDVGADTATPVSGSDAADSISVLDAEIGSFTLINSANGSSSWQNFLNAPTAGSTLYTVELPEDVTVKGVVKINLRAALSSLGSTASDVLRVHAKLVEVARPGTTLKYFGGNAVGSSIAVDRLAAGGVWQGGGVANLNLAKFRQTTTGTYREIAKGWMDLCNPGAGFDSYTATRTNRIVPSENIGVFHDYTLYLQPSVHTAKAGNKLALIITTGGTTNAGAVTGNNAFTFTVDNSSTYATIPTEFREISIDSDMSIKATVVPMPGEDFAPEFNIVTSKDVNVNLIVASYDASGRLVSTSNVAKALKAGDADVIKAALPYAAGLSYKFFLWNDAYVPLAKANTIDRL